MFLYDEKLLAEIREINKVSIHAYGKGAVALQRDADGRRRFSYERKSLLLIDEFDGGNPFCGVARVIRKADNTAIWGSYYHGWLTDEATKYKLSAQTVFDFMRLALQRPDPHTVLRGPELFEADGLRYMNRHEYGSLRCFYGEETILVHGGDKPVYRCRYGGGLVNLTEDMGEAGTR